MRQVTFDPIYHHTITSLMKKDTAGFSENKLLNAEQIDHLEQDADALISITVRVTRSRRPQFNNSEIQGTRGDAADMSGLWIEVEKNSPTHLQNDGILWSSVAMMAHIDQNYVVGSFLRHVKESLNELWRFRSFNVDASASASQVANVFVDIAAFSVIRSPSTSSTNARSR